MVSLDSPLVTLGGLYLVGQSRRGRQFTGGLNGKSLLAGGFGASSAQWAGDQVSNLLGATGEGTITPQLAQALAGGAVSYAGQNTSMLPQSWTNPIAAGIHYNVAQQAFTQAGASAGDLFGNLGGSNGTNGTAGMVNTSPTAAMPTSGREAGVTF